MRRTCQGASGGHAGIDAYVSAVNVFAVDGASDQHTVASDVAATFHKEQVRSPVWPELSDQL